MAPHPNRFQANAGGSTEHRAMKVDVIVVNYRGADDTRRAVAMLAPWTRGRCWVVDNSDSDREFATLVAGLGPVAGVQLRRAPGNLGFGRGCNLAFAESDAELVLLLNPDARISPDAIERLVRAFDDPRVGAASPRIYVDARHRWLTPPATIQGPWAEGQAALDRMRPATALRRAARQIQRAAEAQAPDAPGFDVAMLAGAVMMVRRSAALAAGGLFDPGYFMFFEDADLSCRLRRSGYRLRLEPGAHAVHSYRHSAFKAPLMAESRDRFLRTQYPLFHAATGGLRLLHGWHRFADRLNAPRPASPLTRSAEDLRTLTAGAGILAFSPSPSGWPAAFRPVGEEASPIDDEDWALFEPGEYRVLTLAPPGIRWTAFRKPAATE